MVTLKINEIQAWRLFQHIEKKAKGRAHGKRLDRIFDAFGLARVEEAFEKNQEVIEEFQTNGKAVPKSALTAFRHDDPAKEVQLEEGDFEKIYQWTREWDKYEELEDKDADKKALEYRLHYPLLDAIDEAHAAWKS